MRMNPFIIGLTGGIATGKSVVRELFQNQGCDVFDADACVHELLDADALVIRAVKKAFGERIMGVRGIDRKKLKTIAFSSQRRLHLLERILHPRVLECMCRAIKRSQHEFFVAEIPMLYEKRWDRYVDAVVVAACPVARQVARLRARDKMQISEINRIRSFQMPLKEKMKRADIVIDTDRPRAAVAACARVCIRCFKGEL